MPLVARIGIVMMPMPAGECFPGKLGGLGCLLMFVRSVPAAGGVFAAFLLDGLGGSLDRITGCVLAGMFVMPAAPE